MFPLYLLKYNCLIFKYITTVIILLSVRYTLILSIYVILIYLTYIHKQLYIFSTSIYNIDQGLLGLVPSNTNLQILILSK
jgi:hypothetical protein